MKYLVDAQLPKSLSDFLKTLGLNSFHTLELPKANNTTDGEILLISKTEERIVISKDADFLESHLIKNVPEKLILIKTGNINNEELINIFKLNIDFINLSIKENNLIEINKTEIIIHK